MKKDECLPIIHVLRTVRKVEEDVTKFYRRAVELGSNPETRKTFQELLMEKEQNHPELEKVCQEIECVNTSLEATTDDIHYLSTLAESAFYRRTGNLAELVSPLLEITHLIENAARLEKNLILFYARMFNISCPAHRPVFSRQLQLAQRHVGILDNLKARLSAGRRN